MMRCDPGSLSHLVLTGMQGSRSFISKVVLGLCITLRVCPGLRRANGVVFGCGHCVWRCVCVGVGCGLGTVAAQLFGVAVGLGPCPGAGACLEVGLGASLRVGLGVGPAR